MTPLGTPFFELAVAPLATLLAVVHAARALGAARAAVEFLALAAYGYALERIAIGVFASHEYSASWRAAPGGVPLAVAACWAAVILSALGLAHRLGRRAATGLAVAAALAGTSLDLLMEPVAVRSGLWRWTPPGPWHDVPIGNFVGWGVIVGVYVLGAERQGDHTSSLLQGARRLGLGALAIGALVLVGLAWTRLGAERVFEGGRGGLVAGGILLSLLALTGGGDASRPSAPASLGARLGAAGRPWAILAIALAFAANAALVGEPALVALAAAVLAVLGRALAK